MPYTIKSDDGERTYSGRALLRALLDRIPVSIYFKDRDGRFLLTSRGLYERLGCTSLDEIVGRHDRDFFDESHAIKAAADEARILEAAVDMIDCIEEEVWANGRTAWVSTIKLPLHDDEGDIVGTFGISMDVTVQKRAEEALRAARNEAELAGQELEATLEDLVSTQDRLLQSQKLEAIGQLAAGVAHEINTPIQFVTDNTSYLAESLGLVSKAYRAAQAAIDEVRGSGVATTAVAAFDEFHRLHAIEELLDDLPDAASESLDGTARVAEIVRALKAFAHPGSETMDTVDLNEVVESTLTVSRNEWKYVADVITELSPDLPPIVANRGQLQQTLLILLVNAAQAIGAQGYAEKGEIKVGTQIGEGEAEIWVEDSGGGIPEEIQEKVFDPFFTTKEVGVGSGQGLTMAHQIIVEQHDGALDFVSVPGSSTRFSIRLPLSREK
jgi:PAS domain S-box-containing protein